MRRTILMLIFAGLALSLKAQDEKEINYYSHISFGFNLGNLQRSEFGSNTKSGGIGFRYSMGYEFNRWLSVGGGIGYEFYNFDNPDVFIPVYAEIRGDLTEWKVRPIYSMELGWGVKVLSQFENWDNKPNGVYFRPAVGWKFQKRERFASSISFGYELQHAKFRRDDSWDDDLYIVNIKRLYQRYSINFGFEF